MPRRDELHWSEFLFNPLIAARAGYYAYSTNLDEASVAAWSKGRAGGKADKVIQRRFSYFESASTKALGCCAKAIERIHRSHDVQSRNYPLAKNPSADAGTAAEVYTITEARRVQNDERDELHAERKRGSDLHTEPKSKGWMITGYGLLGADAAGLCYSLIGQLNVSFAPLDAVGLSVAMAFSIFGAGVQGVLAHLLGDRLWFRRNVLGVLAANEPKPAVGATVALMVALGVVSVGAGATIFVRLVDEIILANASVGLALPIALMLASCAVIAPWIIVSQLTYDGSTKTRKIAALGRLITHVEGLVARLRGDAHELIVRAQHHLVKMRARKARLTQRIKRFYRREELFLRMLWSLRSDRTVKSDGLPYIDDIDIAVHLSRVDDLIKATSLAVTEATALLNDPLSSRPDESKPVPA